MAILLKTDGTEQIVLPKDREAGFTLEEVYDLLGCSTVEHHRLLGDSALLMDENARLNNKPLNQSASEHFARKYNCTVEDLINGNEEKGIMADYHIVGDALLITEREFQ